MLPVVFVSFHFFFSFFVRELLFSQFPPKYIRTARIDWHSSKFVSIEDIPYYGICLTIGWTAVRVTEPRKLDRVLIYFCSFVGRYRAPANEQESHRSFMVLPSRYFENSDMLKTEYANTIPLLSPQNVAQTERSFL